jgi:hypothetical protein
MCATRVPNRNTLGMRVIPRRLSAHSLARIAPGSDIEPLLLILERTWLSPWTA